MESIVNIINFINEMLWSPALICLCLGSGIYFSFITRFLQVRHIKDMVKCLFGGQSSNEGVTSFQAFAMSVAGRVGTGNIAGVATAIALGGPGAVFWMWAIAFLGAGSSFIECALGQVYKEKIDGQYRGGPAYYIDKGLGIRWYGILFALATIFAMGLLLPGVQSNSIASSISNAFEINPAISGIIIVALLALIIYGGVKRIGKTAEIIVPFMAIAYIFVAIIVMALNYDKIPDVFKLIFTSAFGTHQMFGGILGSAIAWGVKRGIYSNEAGQGTGPQSAAAAEVSHPAIQGLVQAFAVYVDTLFVCSATAFMILITGQYNVQNGVGGYIANNIGNVEIGPIYTQLAIESALPGFGAPFVAIALFFFAFTTIMAYYYITETNIAYLTRGSKNSKIIINIFRIVFLISVFFGAMNTATTAWTMGDIGVAMMAWLNIIAILLLGNVGIKVLKDYEYKKKNGIDLYFDPDEIGIKNADVWREINKKDKKEQS